jgi:predicted O-methyltransferase YrrM
VLSYLSANPAEAVRRLRLFGLVAPYTKVSRAKLGRLRELAQAIERDRVPGALVECGVFKGGGAAVIAASAAPSREVYLFDSFEGLPPPGAEDGRIAQAQYSGGWCAGTEEDVRTIFAALGLLGPRVHFVKGWFQDTFAVSAVGPIALLHIDADWYDSVRLCLERFWDDVSPGGYVVFDDYARWEGCTRAVDEFLAARRLEPLAPTGRAGHYLRKAPARPSAV